MTLCDFVTLRAELVMLELGIGIPQGRQAKTRLICEGGSTSVLSMSSSDGSSVSNSGLYQEKRGTTKTPKALGNKNTRNCVVLCKQFVKSKQTCLRKQQQVPHQRPADRRAGVQ